MTNTCNNCNKDYKSIRRLAFHIEKEHPNRIGTRVQVIEQYDRNI